MTGLKVACQLALLLLVPLLLLRLAYRRRHGTSNCRNQKLPPSPPWRLPIIGHLHLVGSLPHISLRDLAAKHGRDGLMLLHLGAVPNLVASTASAGEEILRTHDSVFASRPPSRICDDLLYGSTDIAFSPYNHHWRQARKLVNTHLLTVNKVHAYCAARREEVRLVIAKMREAAAASTAMDMGEAMNTFSNDIISRAVSGKFFRAEGRNKIFRELVDTNSILFGGFNLEEYFPGLADSLVSLGRWFRLGDSKAVEAHHRKWDELLETIVSEHERKRKSGKSEGDFTDVLLSAQEEYGMTRDHVKAILLKRFAEAVRRAFSEAGIRGASTMGSLEMEIFRDGYRTASVNEFVEAVKNKNRL